MMTNRNVTTIAPAYMTIVPAATNGAPCKRKRPQTLITTKANETAPRAGFDCVINCTAPNNAKPEKAKNNTRSIQGAADAAGPSIQPANTKASKPQMPPHTRVVDRG